MLDFRANFIEMDHRVDVDQLIVTIIITVIIIWSTGFVDWRLFSDYSVPQFVLSSVQIFHDLASRYIPCNSI